MTLSYFPSINREIQYNQLNYSIRVMKNDIKQHINIKQYLKYENYDQMCKALYNLNYKIYYRELYSKMIQTYRNSNIQSCLSDSQPVPFVGKYHAVLRKRKNQSSETQQKPKKQYKKKKIHYRNLITIYQQWKLELPLSEKHVFNFHNMLAINEVSMRDPQSDQSFICSKFYMKKVKKANIFCNSLLLTLQDVQEQCTPIPYLCQRLKSFGDVKFFQFALAIQHLEETLPQIHKKLHKQQQVDQHQLDSFLSQMDQKLFLSQYSPHLLIISSPLLQLLGYDVQQFAIQSLKHKSILYEFFSAEHYTGVLYKHLQNIELLRQYLEGVMSLEEFCQKSMMVYNDFVYNRLNRKIKCQFFAGTSKQLTPYIELKQMDDKEEVRIMTPEMKARKLQIEEYKEQRRKNEISLLKQLINIPKQLDPNYRQKICTYQMLQNLIDKQAEVNNL